MSDAIFWPSWLGGLSIGLFALAQYWITNHQLGCSLGYGHVCGLVSRAEAFHSGELAPADNWRLWFLLGLPLGGLVAVLTSPTTHFSANLSMGQMYDQVMPSALWAKTLLLTAGGALMGTGARMAGGCTSGHVIAGCALLNPPSLLAGALFFSGGLVTVQILFRLFS